MNELDVVVDVRPSPETAELIVTKQKVAFSGEAHLVGSPVESRIGLVTAKHLQSVIDRSGITFHRRAMPLFDTLTEGDRVAVIKAVAPLRGVEKDQWPAVGVEPLDGKPLAFFVRAGEYLVVVTPTEDKGVEVVDIVRQATLDWMEIPDEGPCRCGNCASRWYN
jgi:hypothetical protein